MTEKNKKIKRKEAGGFTGRVGTRGALLGNGWCRIETPSPGAATGFRGAEARI